MVVIDPAAVRRMKPHADKVQVGGRAVIYRRYLRYDPGLGAIVVFEWNYRFWFGETAFAPQRKEKVLGNQIERRRQGVLLHRRKQ